jgi:periplasmic protein TonB
VDRQRLLRARVLWLVVVAAPLAFQAPTAQAQATVDDLAVGPVGPHERVSNFITPDNPIPPRLQGVLPPYPAAVAPLAHATVVMMLVTIDGTGRVVETRLRRPAAASPTMLAPFEQAALQAVQQWAYEPPVSPPITFRVAFSFEPSTEVRLAAHDPPSTLAGLAAPPQVEAWRAAHSRVPPRIRSRPQLPRRSRDLNPGERQQVVVEIAIDARGRVSGARVVHGPDRLHGAALDAARSFHFSPALADGQPIPFQMRVTILFER